MTARLPYSEGSTRKKRTPAPSRAHPKPADLEARSPPHLSWVSIEHFAECGALHRAARALQGPLLPAIPLSLPGQLLRNKGPVHGLLDQTLKTLRPKALASWGWRGASPSPEQRALGISESSGR